MTEIKTAKVLKKKDPLMQNSRVEETQVSVVVYRSHIYSFFRTIYAFDHKEERIAIFQERMEAAGVTCKVARCMDFLRVKTDSQTYKDVQYVVVDPSCSGSGQMQFEFLYCFRYHTMCVWGSLC